MVNFKDLIDEDASQRQLGMAALELAIACRDELAVSWGADAWAAHQPVGIQPSQIIEGEKMRY